MNALASQHEQNDLLRQAIDLARTGDRARARALLEQVLQADEYNELAWMWMAAVAENKAQRREALEIALEINPENQSARQALERLGGPRAGRKARQSAWLANRIGGEAAGEREFQPTVRRPAPELSPPPAAPSPEEIEAARIHRLIELARREQEKAAETAPAPFAPEPVEYYDFAGEMRRRWLRRIGAFVGTLLLIVIGAALVMVVVMAASEALKPPPPTATPTPELATVLALMASPTPTATLPPTGVLVTLPAEVEESLQPPTWTPSPTPTASVTPLPTATPLSPDRYSLLFSSRREGDQRRNLYTVRGDGSGERRLTDDSADVRAPVPAPDGLRAACVLRGAGEDAVPELALLPLGELPAVSAGEAGAGEPPAPQVILRLGGERFSRPSWSPDGARLTFSSDADGDDDVYIVNADGSGLANLTNNAAIIDRDPAWSPDGRAIVFASDRDGPGQTELYRMNADGTGIIRLTDAGGSSFRPAWSPDGRWIVFVSDRARDADLYVMNADGSDEHLLTRDDGSAEDRDPAWSPDGRWIAFSSNRQSDAFQLYLIDPAGGDILRVTRSAGDDLEPAWPGR